MRNGAQSRYQRSGPASNFRTGAWASSVPKIGFQVVVIQHVLQTADDSVSLDDPAGLLITLDRGAGRTNYAAQKNQYDSSSSAAEPLIRVSLIAVLWLRD